MSAMAPAHRTTPTLPIYSVLAVAAVVPPSQSDWPSGSGDWPRSNVANGSVWKCLAVSGPEGVKRFCGLHAAVLAVIGRSESGPTGSVCGSVGAPRGGRSANQMSAMVLAHRTTPTLPIYSVLAVAAVVPPSHKSEFAPRLLRSHCAAQPLRMLQHRW